MESYQKLMEVLVKKTMEKYNIEPEKINLSNEEKNELRNVVTGLQKEVDEFLKKQVVVSEKEEEKGDKKPQNLKKRKK
ncbi:hypothetical protein [Thalassobacillus sp. C254]|uniref:hypothetical protein n=1 Tax=Thalassobacillus sp. C254 TaxID=1225341 RepID=UPI0006D20F78|nr:hypothetical protein [Thalassobacillus sp. C254]